MLTQIPLTPVAINYTCDVCGLGQMELIDDSMKGYENAIKFDPPQYAHVCNNCSHEQSFLVAFPALRYANQGEEMGLNEFDFEIKE